jgi:putative endonuclease
MGFLRDQLFPACENHHVARSPGDPRLVCMSGGCTRAIVKALDWIAARTLPAEAIPAHQLTGRRGEEEAYFYLRRHGYVMVARNFRSPRRRSEIDLIGWDGDVLCLIEVKTRTSHEVKPAEAAVDREKQKDLRLVARDYLRHAAPPSCQWRFDVVSVYYEKQTCQIELFKNAFSVS